MIYEAMVWLEERSKEIAFVNSKHTSSNLIVLSSKLNGKLLYLELKKKTNKQNCRLITFDSIFSTDDEIRENTTIFISYLIICLLPLFLSNQNKKKYKKAWKMKFARTQHSICLASAKKWIQPKPWTSKHSRIKMALLHQGIQEPWAPAHLMHTCIRDPDRNRWWVKIIIYGIFFKTIFQTFVNISWRIFNFPFFDLKLIKKFYSPNQNRYARKNSQGGQSSIYSPAPEYDDPANCAEEDQYVSLNFTFYYLKTSINLTTNENLIIFFYLFTNLFWKDWINHKFYDFFSIF